MPGVTPPLTFTLQKLVAPPSALGSTGAEGSAGRAGERRRALQQPAMGRGDRRVSRRFCERSPSLSVINLQIAAAYRNKKDYDGAIAAYNALLKIDPANDKAKVGIAMTSLEKGDLDMAERTLEIAAQAPGATREVFYDLGEVKLARSQPARGRQGVRARGAGRPDLGQAAVRSRPDRAGQGRRGHRTQVLPDRHGRRSGFAGSRAGDHDAPAARTDQISREPLLWRVARSVAR